MFKQDEWVEVTFSNGSKGSGVYFRYEDGGYVVNVYLKHKNKFILKWFSKENVTRMPLEKFENSKEILINLALDMKDKKWFRELVK